MIHDPKIEGPNLAPSNRGENMVKKYMFGPQSNVLKPFTFVIYKCLY